MTPYNSRLPREEFRSRGYKTTPTPFFLLKNKKNGVGYLRIGVVIGKAIYKEATKRNFWERQAKAMLLKNVPAGNDILVIFVAAKVKPTKKQFQENMESAIKKLKQ